MTNLKIAALGALVTIGLASAATAQQVVSRDQASRPTTSGQKGMMGHNQMMMNDPEMRKQMTDMMDGCSKMMKKMGDMQMDAKPKG